MLSNGLGQMAEGTEATARRPTTPPPEFSFGKLAVGVCVNGLESLTQTHRTAKLSVLAAEVFTLRLTLLTEIPSVAAQTPHRPFELCSLALQLEAHLIEGFAGQHHDVELVENDAGLRKVLGRTFHIGGAHIHRDRLDLGGIAPVQAQRFGEGSQGLDTASLDHQEQT